MIIALEGMDGCGKTTIAKRLADKIGYDYIEKPNRDLMNMGKDEYEDMLKVLYAINNPTIIATFIGLGNLLQANVKDNVVLDRHILSNYYWNGRKENEDIFKSFVKNCPKNTINIVLYASPEIRKNRIIARNPNDEDLDESKVFNLGYDKILKFANENDMNCLIFDTDNLNLDEVFEQVISMYEKIKDLKPSQISEICEKFNKPTLDKIKNKFGIELNKNSQNIELQ